jgi:hypothetical protein
MLLDLTLFLSCSLAQLQARAAMLELLRSSIDLMHAELAVLIDRLELDASPFDP